MLVSLLTTVLLQFMRISAEKMAAIDTMSPGQGLSSDTAIAQNTETFNFDSSYAGNTGNDLGISTAGYRTGKYNPQEWHAANYGMTYRSTVDREAAGKVHLNFLNIKY